jgi:hypothetical protein
MNTSEAAISFRELLAYTDYLANRWVDYFRGNSGALDINIGGETGSLRELVHHMFMVEQFFANRLLENEPPAKLESPTLDDLMHIHNRAHAQLLNYAMTAGEEELRDSLVWTCLETFEPKNSRAVGPAQRASLGPGGDGSPSGRLSRRQAAGHHHHRCDGIVVEINEPGYYPSTGSALLVPSLDSKCALRIGDCSWCRRLCLRGSNRECWNQRRRRPTEKPRR